MDKEDLETIHASEIGKFDFCPFGWYIEKKGLVDGIKEQNHRAILRGFEEHKRFAVEIEKCGTHSVVSTFLFIALILAFLYVALLLLI
ncbi:MAG: hypothetical protein QW734_07345 [Candidatus Bathyarchaeia archaeon]